MTDCLPADRPRYLMGVGTTRDLLEAVHRGVDMFDCILPTALATQGVAFTSQGRRDLRRARVSRHGRPAGSGLPLLHLHDALHCLPAPPARNARFQATQLVGLHNIHFYMQLMRTMRQHILAGTWLDFYHAQRDVLDARDSYGPKTQHRSQAERKLSKLKRGRYEIVVRDDVGRIRDTVSGEVMHSVNDPAEEARSLYVEQSRLLERLQMRRCRAAGDLGCGPRRRHQCHGDDPGRGSRMPAGKLQRRLQLVSFENDLDSLQLALRHTHWFRHLRHAAPNELLATNRWENAAGSIEWLLLPGDFHAAQARCAGAGHRVLRSRSRSRPTARCGRCRRSANSQGLAQHKATELFTYTYSTRVRAALLAAGFFVAKGRATGPKLETTIALSPLASALPHGVSCSVPNGSANGSAATRRHHMGVVDADDSWRAAVTGHSQFRDLLLDLVHQVDG